MKHLAVFAACWFGFSASAAAQAQSSAASASPAPAALVAGSGSSAFCLFALPAENGNPRWVNLGIVQYVEAREGYVALLFGGGNLGSGHEARLVAKSREEAQVVLNRLRQTAQDCARPSAANSGEAGR